VTTLLAKTKVPEIRKNPGHFCVWAKVLETWDDGGSSHCIFVVTLCRLVALLRVAWLIPVGTYLHPSGQYSL
jgi:hypothetical protein